MLKAVAAILTLVVVAGCAGSPGKEPGKGESATRPDLTVGYTVVPLLNIDPAKSTSMTEGNFQALVLEPLVTLDPNGKVQPLLSTAWKVGEDKLTWTFELRKGVTFHDGTPFNAEAVKYTFERLMDPKTAAPFANNLSAIEKVTAKDELTVEIKTKYPFAPMLATLSQMGASIVSPKAAQEAGLEKFALKPIGTGPYKVESFEPKQPLVAVANDQYWKGKPGFSKVTVKSIPEEASATAALLNGEVDLIWRMPTSQVDAVKGQAQVELLNAPAYTIEYIGFNVEKPPFDNKKVRQAIAHAVNVKAIQQDGMFGYGVVATQPIGPSVWGHDPSLKGREYNPELAKQLLTEAGVSNLKITYLIWADPGKERVAQILQSQLKQAGIDLQIEKRDFGTFVKEAAAGNTQMFVLTWSNATGDVDFNFQSFDSAQVGKANFARFKNSDFDKLNQAQRQSMEPAERQKAVTQALTLLQEESPWVPLVTQEWLVGVRKNVKGIKIFPSGNFYLEGVTKSN